MLDYYDDSYYTSCQCGSGCATDPLNDCSNPFGARVVRGGGFGYSGTLYLRVVYRDSYVPSGRDNNLGFRCRSTAPRHGGSLLPGGPERRGQPGLDPGARGGAPGGVPRCRARPRPFWGPVTELGPVAGQ